jgi:hypothetical protein
LLLWLALLPLVFSTGCSSAIYSLGRYHTVLREGKTQEQVRHALGTPVKSGTDNDEDTLPFRRGHFDVFVVRGPVRDDVFVTGASMSAGMTLGLSEFVAIPQALWWYVFDHRKRSVAVDYKEDRTYKWHFVSLHEPLPKSEPSESCGGRTTSCHAP